MQFNLVHFLVVSLNLIKLTEGASFFGFFSSKGNERSSHDVPAIAHVDEEEVVIVKKVIKLSEKPDFVHHNFILSGKTVPKKSRSSLITESTNGSDFDPLETTCKKAPFADRCSDGLDRVNKIILYLSELTYGPTQYSDDEESSESESDGEAVDEAEADGEKVDQIVANESDVNPVGSVDKTAMDVDSIDEAENVSNISDTDSFDEHTFEVLDMEMDEN